MFTENHTFHDQDQPVIDEQPKVKMLYLPASTATNTLDNRALEKITQCEHPPIALAWFAWRHSWSVSTFKKIAGILDKDVFCVIDKNVTTTLHIGKTTLDACNHIVDQQTDEAASLKELEFMGQKMCFQLNLENTKSYDITEELKQTGLAYCAWHWRLGKSEQSQNDIGNFLNTTETHLRALTGWKKHVLGLNGFCGLQLGEGVTNGGGLCSWNNIKFGESFNPTTRLIDYLLKDNNKVRAPSLLHEWAHALDGMFEAFNDTNKIYCAGPFSRQVFSPDSLFRSNLSCPPSPRREFNDPRKTQIGEALDQLFKAQSWRRLSDLQRAEKTKQWVASLYNKVHPQKRLGALHEMWRSCVQYNGSVEVLPTCATHIFAKWCTNYTVETACMVGSAAEAWVKAAWLVSQLNGRKKVLRFHPYDIVNRLTKNMLYTPQEEKKWHTTTLVERFAQSFKRFAHPAPAPLWDAENEERVFPCEKDTCKKSWEEFFDVVRPILNPYLEETSKEYRT